MKKKYKLNKPITDYSAMELSEFLAGCKAEMMPEKEDEGEKEAPEIEIEINSNGGSVIAGNTMIGEMMQYKGSKYGRIEGICASMAAIFAVCSFKAENLSMRENAVMMTHGARKMAMFEEQDEQKMQDDLALVKIINENFINALMKKTGLPYDECKKKFIDGNNWFSAAQCKEMGLIGSILPAVIDFEVPQLAASDDSLASVVSEINSKLENQFSNPKQENSMDNNVQKVEANVVDDATKVVETNVNVSAAGANDMHAVVKVLESRIEGLQLMASEANRKADEAAKSLVEAKNKFDSESAESKKLIEAYKAESQANLIEKANLNAKIAHLEVRMIVEREFAAINQTNGIHLSASDIEALTRNFFALNTVEKHTIEANGEKTDRLVVKAVSTGTTYDSSMTLSRICQDFAAMERPALFARISGNGYQSGSGFNAKPVKSDDEVEKEKDAFDAEWRANNPITNKLGSKAYLDAYNAKFKSK